MRAGQPALYIPGYFLTCSEFTRGAVNRRVMYSCIPPSLHSMGPNNPLSRGIHRTDSAQHLTGCPEPGPMQSWVYPFGGELVGRTSTLASAPPLAGIDSFSSRFPILDHIHAPALEVVSLRRKRGFVPSFSLIRILPFI